MTDLNLFCDEADVTLEQGASIRVAHRLGCLSGALALLVLVQPQIAFAQATGGAGGALGVSGGWGGAADAAGGAGSGPLPGAGGAAGTDASPNGGSGASGGGGGGAGGGGGGGYSYQFTGDVAAPGGVTGGRGGDGGDAWGPGLPGGGGGGGGGDGARITTTSPAGVETNVTGGSGGIGSHGGGIPGGGGGGGAGVVLMLQGEVTIGAATPIAVRGGDGGDGGMSGSGGGGGAGVLMRGGGGLIVSDNATIHGGGGGRAGNGGTAVKFDQHGSVEVDSGSLLTGGAGASVGSGGNGLAMASGGTVVNAGTIRGGNGGSASGWSDLAAGGTGSGGAAGFVPTPLRGLGSAGISGSGLSIVNSGTIAGGTSSFGQAHAIELSGSNNRFEIRAGSSTIGNVVVAPGGANNVLALGGATNATANISNLMNVHTGFTNFEKTGTSTWGLAGAGSQHWSIQEGTLSGNSSSMAGNLSFATGAGTRGVIFDQGMDDTYSGAISGNGNFEKTGTGILTLANVQSYTGTTAISVGGLRMRAADALASSSGIDLNGGTWDLNGFNQTVKGLNGNPGTNVDLGTATLTVDNTMNATYGGTISGSGGLTKAGPGIFDLTGVNTYSGLTTVAGGWMRLGPSSTLPNSTAINISNGARLNVDGPNALSRTVAVSLTGSGSTFVALTDQQIGSLSGVAGTFVWLNPNVVLTTGTGNTSTTFSGHIGADGNGSLTKVGTGSLILSDTNGYTGATTVHGGSLIVNGSIAASSGVTVAAGATVGGSGTLPTTVINGGTLSPGNSPETLTVAGNLTLTPGSIYLAEVQGAVADRINVTGTASLAGTLRLAPLGGTYSFSAPYTLLSAVGGRTGEFNAVDTTGAFGDGVTTRIGYTASDVLLTLKPKLLAPIVDPVPRLGGGRPANAYAIASAIDGAVANGVDPSSLFGIYNLPAASIPAAVNSLSGEIHTAAPAMAHVASDQFLRTMLDPTAAGRLGAGPTGPGAAVFSGLVRKGADHPVTPSQFDVPSYSLWGSAYGSYGRTDGSAAIGSAKRSIDDAHLATGVDVRLMPGTVAGIAVSGGKARASLPGVLGKIDADVFQAGFYGVTQLGPVKLGGALSYARLENDVSRSIPTLGSTLTSSYATTAWSGRLQASTALLSWNGLSFSPLAAVQATRARSPAVIEANWAGANAGALALAKRNDVTSRSELGLQIDADTVLGSVPVTGYVRAAWAHYFRRDADLTASLIGLPGASFTATGAEADRNSALLSTGIMAKLSERVSLGLNLDGELSGNSSRLGGSAQLRVSF